MHIETISAVRWASCVRQKSTALFSIVEAIDVEDTQDSFDGHGQFAFPVGDDQRVVFIASPFP